MKKSEESSSIHAIRLENENQEACAFHYLCGAFGALTESGEPLTCEVIAKFFLAAEASSRLCHPVQK